MTNPGDTSWCDPAIIPNMDDGTREAWFAIAALVMVDYLWERYYLARKRKAHLASVRRRMKAEEIAAREAVKNLTPEEKKERRHEQQKAASRRWWKLHGKEWQEKRKKEKKQ